MATNATTTAAQALLITGNTYVFHREIKSLGGLWNPEHGGWIVPSANRSAAEDLVAQLGLKLSECEIEPSDLERPSGDQLRAIRQHKLDGKIERWRARASRLEAEAERLDKQVEPYDDFAFWTQPILIGHHSERGHRKLRDRLGNKMQKAFELRQEARQRRERSDAAERSGARIADDKERERQEQRAAMDEKVRVGSIVFDFAFGQGTVVRVNKKTYSIRFESGSTYARDKTFVRPRA